MRFDLAAIELYSF